MSTDTPATPVPAKRADAVKPAETMSQQNARRRAASYLRFSAFSRSRLIYQLEVVDGYSTEDATYSVDAVSPNWEQQAVRAAESYLDAESYVDSEDYLGVSALSRTRMIDQLTFDGFTQAQAEHAANSVGL